MKFIIGIILGAVVVLFIAQNLEVVEITFIAWTLSVSRAIVVLFIFLFGLIIGWLAKSLGIRKRERARRE
jgi:uncharacterized integral membrane protein